MTTDDMIIDATNFFDATSDDEEYVHLARMGTPMSHCGGSNPGHRPHFAGIGWKKRGKPKYCPCGTLICPACMQLSELLDREGILG
jgi:hypothetical protein